MAGENKIKATALEVSARIDEVLRIRLDGAQYHDLVQYAAEKEWNLKERQLRNYLRRADELILSRRDKRRKRIVALHMARRESLYGRSVNAADYRTALAVLSDMAKLQGLYPADKPKGEPPTNAGVPVELLTRLIALTGVHAGGVGPAAAGAAVDPEPRPAEPGVPE
jgi:hypothetical protein